MRVRRIALRVLAWVAMTFFFGYYTYLVLVFGATLSLEQMSGWLAKSCVSGLFSETIVTSMVLGVKLFISYVTARLLMLVRTKKSRAHALMLLRYKKSRRHATDDEV